MTDTQEQEATPVDDFLSHYGVKGMKWGVRKERSAVEVSTKERPGRKVKASGGKFHKPSEDAVVAARTRQQAKKSTTDSLSNKELQALVTRMNLEQQYSNLNKNNVGLGKKVARMIFGQVNDQDIASVSTRVTEEVGLRNPSKAKIAGRGTTAGLNIAKSSFSEKKKK